MRDFGLRKFDLTVRSCVAQQIYAFVLSKSYPLFVSQFRSAALCNTKQAMVKRVLLLEGSYRWVCVYFPSGTPVPSSSVGLTPPVAGVAVSRHRHSAPTMVKHDLDIPTWSPLRLRHFYTAPRRVKIRGIVMHVFRVSQILVSSHIRRI